MKIKCPKCNNILAHATQDGLIKSERKVLERGPAGTSREKLACYSRNKMAWSCTCGHFCEYEIGIGWTTDQTLRMSYVSEVFC